MPLDDVLEKLCKLRICESDRIKTVIEQFDMEIHQKILMRGHQKLRAMVKGSSDQKSDCETLMPGMREMNQGQWLRIAGINVVLKEDGGECYQWKTKGQRPKDKRAKPAP